MKLNYLYILKCVIKKSPATAGLFFMKVDHFSVDVARCGHGADGLAVACYHLVVAAVVGACLVAPGAVAADHHFVVVVWSLVAVFAAVGAVVAGVFLAVVAWVAVVGVPDPAVCGCSVPGHED